MKVYLSKDFFEEWQHFCETHQQVHLNALVTASGKRYMIWQVHNIRRKTPVEDLVKHINLLNIQVFQTCPQALLSREMMILAGRDDPGKQQIM